MQLDQVGSQAQILSCLRHSERIWSVSHAYWNPLLGLTKQASKGYSDFY